jgi:hypothetical protein
VEEEAMKFLKRLFGQEQLRRPPAPVPENGAANGGSVRRPAAVPAGYEFIRL